MRERLSVEAERLLDAGRADSPANMGARQEQLLATIETSEAALVGPSVTGSGHPCSAWRALAFKGLGVVVLVAAIGVVRVYTTEAPGNEALAPVLVTKVSAGGAPELTNGGPQVTPAAREVAGNGREIASAVPEVPRGVLEGASLADNEPPAVSVHDLPASPSNPMSRVPSVHLRKEALGADDLSAQLAAIDGVRRSLARGDGRGALTELEAFAKRFPRSELGDEVVALHVEALVKAQRADEAERIARAFLHTRPDSLYAPRITSLITASASNERQARPREEK